jgi:formamidase
MSGIVTLRVNLIRGGVALLSLKSPMYQTSPSEPSYPRRLVFTGLSVLPNGVQTDCSGLVAYRNAAFSAIEYLQKLGFSREQAYILLSVAPIETKVVATANRPNFVVSLGLPIDIFHFDILPSALGKGSHQIAGLAVPSEGLNGH